MDIAFAVMFSVLVAMLVGVLFTTSPWTALAVLGLAIWAFTMLRRRRLDAHDDTRHGSPSK